MSRTKNRKKRRLGRIHKQAVNADPMLLYMVFEDRCISRFDTWCGFEKWFWAAENEAYETYTENDEKELEFEYVDVSLCSKRLVFPNMTEEGRLRRMNKHLKAYMEFDDSKIKGKQYHSKQVTYYRKKRIAEYIEQYHHWIRVMETANEQNEE